MVPVNQTASARATGSLHLHANLAQTHIVPWPFWLHCASAQYLAQTASVSSALLVCWSCLTTARYHREKQQTRQHLPAKPASKLPQQRGVQCLQGKGHITMEGAGLQQLLLLLLGLRSDPTGQLLAVEIQVLILSLLLDKHDLTKGIYLSRLL